MKKCRRTASTWWEELQIGGWIHVLSFQSLAKCRELTCLCVPFRGAEYVSAREWMRICFELLELLKAHKKAIRRATVNTFGYIAKAIG